MQNFKISVALTTYNGQKYLESQLESILNQTVSPFEVVVCDDGSADNTVNILKRFAVNDSRLKIFVNDTNLGYVQNFAQAISLCTGDLIVLSDQDDIWFPRKIERILQEFNKNVSCGLVVHDAEVINAQSKSLGYRLYEKRNVPKLNIDTLLKQVNIKGCTMAFRSETLKYIYPIGEKGWGHDDWILFILGVLTQICMLNEPLIYYRTHSNNFGSDAMHKGRIEKLFGSLGDFNQHTYYQEVEKWKIMLAHFKTLVIKYGNQLDKTQLKEITLHLEDRYLFAKQRLDIFLSKRENRFVPATRLLLTGKYKIYRKGYKSFLKDIVS